MLTETFVASTQDPDKPSNAVVTGIHFHECRPLSTLKSTFKKSSTPPNCLAISQSHVFAAQSDKAVVHVYSREKNNQEAVVPFPEKIRSITLAGESDGAGTLVLGTEGGRVLLWELATGRQVSTPQHHLQPITCLAVDPTSNFLLSGSSDSRIHVWSIEALLSFSASITNGASQELPFSPQRSLSHHRAAVTAIVTGHSFSRNNIAVSASEDSTCIVWDYLSGDILHTFLLSASPLCLALDPADRAVYAGYDDGSIQYIDFYSLGGLVQPLYNPTSRSTPTQPPPNTRWPALDQSAVLCLQVCYDGTGLLSGHQGGKIHVWDVALGRYGKQLADFAAPVTNLIMLKPSGFAMTPQSSLKLHKVVKPRYESFANSNHLNFGAVPSNYTFTAQFTSDMPPFDSTHSSSFQEALTHSSFPASMLDEALAELMVWQTPSKATLESTELAELRMQNVALSSQLQETTESYRIAVAQAQEHANEDQRRQKEEEVKAARKQRRRLRRMKAAELERKTQMGLKNDDADEEMGGDSTDDEGLSSSTDELTDID